MTRMLGAGEYRHRITLQQAQQARNDIGDTVTTWVPTLTRIAASVQPLRGRELFAAAQTQATVDHRITIRYRKNITRDLRIIWHSSDGDVPLDIISVINTDAANVQLELMAVTGVRNGLT